MAAKLGVADDHQKTRDEVQVSTVRRVDVDQRAAKMHVASIINENRKRLDEFDDHDRESINEEDLDEQKFNNPNSLNTSVEAPKIFKGELKAY